MVRRCLEKDLVALQICKTPHIFSSRGILLILHSPFYTEDSDSVFGSEETSLQVVEKSSTVEKNTNKIPKPKARIVTTDWDDSADSLLIQAFLSSDPVTAPHGKVQSCKSSVVATFNGHKPFSHKPNAVASFETMEKRLSYWEQEIKRRDAARDRLTGGITDELEIVSGSAEELIQTLLDERKTHEEANASKKSNKDDHAKAVAIMQAQATSGGSVSKKRKVSTSSPSPLNLVIESISKDSGGINAFVEEMKEGTARQQQLQQQQQQQQQESQNALTQVMLAGQQAAALQATAQSESMERMMKLNAESQERMMTAMLEMMKEVKKG
mmetsp:Transcript_26512/g.50217  ORF Transcript_26512/g.50217 Transcript_26512/m.50217 type:complete len:326 (-) Transcript_26512:163-1140(-)